MNILAWNMHRQPTWIYIIFDWTTICHLNKMSFVAERSRVIVLNDVIPNVIHWWNFWTRSVTPTRRSEQSGSGYHWPCICSVYKCIASATMDFIVSKRVSSRCFLQFSTRFSLPAKRNKWRVIYLQKMRNAPLHPASQANHCNISIAD